MRILVLSCAEDEFAEAVDYYYPVPKVLNIILAIHFLHKNPCFEPIFFIQ
jgi:hypothetical protein